MTSGGARLLIQGSIVNYDAVIAEALLQCGFDVKIARHISQPIQLDKLPFKPKLLTDENIRLYRSGLDFIPLALKADCIFTVSIGLTGAFGRLWPLAFVLPLPPIVTVATGSDVSEQIVAPTFDGWLTRRLAKKARRLLIPAYRRALSNTTRLRLSNWDILRYPYLLPPQHITQRSEGDDIVFLHATNIDWGKTDSHSGRVTKGSDKFLRAFIVAAQQRPDIRCIILDRGPDRHLAREMVERSPVAHRFEWMQEVDQARLRELFAQCDVVADQFEVGGFGMIALEAMAAGKAVMIHLDEPMLRLVYNDRPPVLCCQSEADVLNSILGAVHQDLQTLGRKAQSWVHENHGINQATEFLRLQISVAMGTAYDCTRTSA